MCYARPATKSPGERRGRLQVLPMVAVNALRHEPAGRSHAMAEDIRLVVRRTNAEVRTALAGQHKQRAGTRPTAYGDPIARLGARSAR